MPATAIRHAYRHCLHLGDIRWVRGITETLLRTLRISFPSETERATVSHHDNERLLFVNVFGVPIGAITGWAVERANDQGFTLFLPRVTPLNSGGVIEQELRFDWCGPDPDGERAVVKITLHRKPSLRYELDRLRNLGHAGVFKL